jgi:hypothetical protein
MPRVTGRQNILYRPVLFSVRLRLVELLHSGTAKLEAGSAGSFSNGRAEIAWL